MTDQPTALVAEMLPNNAVIDSNGDHLKVFGFGPQIVIAPASDNGDIDPDEARVLDLDMARRLAHLLTTLADAADTAEGWQG